MIIEAEAAQDAIVQTNREKRTVAVQICRMLEKQVQATSADRFPARLTVESKWSVIGDSAELEVVRQAKLVVKSESI